MNVPVQDLFAVVESLRHCTMTQIIELLAMLQGDKPAVRLVLDELELPRLVVAACARGLVAVPTSTRLAFVTHAQTGDVFTESVAHDNPRAEAVAAFVARDQGVARSLAMAESDGESSVELGVALGLPLCCAESYGLIQAGRDWLEEWSASGTGPFDNAANHLASFGAGVSPAGEYLPCGPGCKATADRARIGARLARASGLGKLIALWERWTLCDVWIVDRTAYILSPPGGEFWFRVGAPHPELERKLSMDESRCFLPGVGRVLRFGNSNLTA